MARYHEEYRALCAPLGGDPLPFHEEENTQHGETHSLIGGEDDALHSLCGDAVAWGMDGAQTVDELLSPRAIPIYRKGKRYKQARVYMNSKICSKRPDFAQLRSLIRRHLAQQRARFSELRENPDILEAVVADMETENAVLLDCELMEESRYSSYCSSSEEEDTL